MTTPSTPGPMLLAEAAAGRVQARALAEKAALFDELLGGDIDPAVGDARPDPAWLRSELRRSRVNDPESTAASLTDRYHALSPPDARVFGVALVRALAPRGALATVPRGNWFSPSEIGVIDAMEVPSPSGTRVDLLQAPGQAIDYRGYLCAIVKLTRACNLRCSYCHDWREGKGVTMDLPSLARTVQQTMASGAGYVEFVWHGGEPLLVGARGIVRFLMLQEHFAPPHTVVSNQVQSNGTVLTDRVRRLLKLFSLRVSVSLDGPQVIHDAQRRDKRGAPTWERVKRGIADLQRDGLLSGVLMVVSRSVLALDPALVWAAVVETGTASVCFLAERPSPGDPVPVTSAEFVEFLLAIDRVRRREGSSVAVRELDAVGRLVRGASGGFCELVGSCIGHYVTIDPDGTVAHCDKYVGADEFVLGNLGAESLRDILSGPRVRLLRARNAQELDAVRGCRWFDLCQGWCPHERFVDEGYRDRGCCGLEGLFAASVEAVP